MLYSAKKLQGFSVRASDGELGEIKDVYFDDERWVVRYLIVDTGKWLSGRKVLISPYAVKRIDERAHAVAVDLTRQQVERSPGIDMDKPVSRQQEGEYHRYYGYPEYWPYTTFWAWGAMPVVVPPDPRIRDEIAEREAREAGERARESDVHLRSSKEVIGYHIQATDEPVGHVEDFLFEEDTWAIQHFAVDTRNWLPGRHVLISPKWIRDVSWSDRTVSVDLDRSQIEESPQYDSTHAAIASLEAAGRDARRSKR